MPNGTSDPVEEARLLVRTSKSGSMAQRAHLAALEAALTQRAQQPLVEALKRAEAIVASFVKARDAFHYDNFGGEVERHLERAMEDAYGFLHGLPDDLRDALAKAGVK